MTSFIHKLADVQSLQIGSQTRIWQYVVIFPGAVIGNECNICSHCLIENDVRIGNRVTVKSGVQLWDGLRIGDDVFIGPNATFSNDKFPRSRKKPSEFAVTEIETGASIGAGATVLPGVVIGAKAMVGSGAVVTRSVPQGAIVVGNPARIVGYVDTEHLIALNDREQVVEKAVPRRSKANGVSLISLPRVEDIRGSLCVGEFQKDIPFEVKRYFLVYNVPSIETRGAHAHRECHQFLVCVHGQVSVLIDDGKCREEHLLTSLDVGIHLPPLTWSVQYKYSPDAVLLVFASHYYEPGDYIRDYREFEKIAAIRAAGKS